MVSELKQEKKNRRGCFLVVAGIVLVLALLASLGLGLFGNVEGGKATDLPILDGSSSSGDGARR